MVINFSVARQRKKCRPVKCKPDLRDPDLDSMNADALGGGMTPNVPCWLRKQVHGIEALLHISVRIQEEEIDCDPTSRNVQRGRKIHQRTRSRGYDPLRFQKGSNGRRFTNRGIFAIVRGWRKSPELDCELCESEIDALVTKSERQIISMFAWMQPIGAY